MKVACIYVYCTCTLYAFSGAASQDFVTAAGTILLTYTVLVRGLKPSWGNPGEFETLCVVRMHIHVPLATAVETTVIACVVFMRKFTKFEDKNTLSCTYVCTL